MALAVVWSDAREPLLRSEIWLKLVEAPGADRAMAFQVANYVALKLSQTTNPPY